MNLTTLAQLAPNLCCDWLYTPSCMWFLLIRYSKWETCKALQRWCRLCVERGVRPGLELSTAQFHTFWKNPPQEAKNTGMHGVCILILLVRSNLRTLKISKMQPCTFATFYTQMVWGCLGHILFSSSAHPPTSTFEFKKNSSKILKFYHPCAPHARCGSYKCSYKCCTWYSTSIRAHIYRRT